MGIAYRHEKGFRIARPAGTGDNLLVIFKSSALLETDGSVKSVAPDTAVLFARSSPQYYGSDGGEFVNHWVHFGCEESDPFFARTGVEFDRPRALRSVGSAETILEMLGAQSIAKGGRRDECVNLLIRLLINETVGSDRTADKSSHSERLKALRAEIYGNPAGKFTVSGLSERLRLSPSRFQALYHEEFGVSCYEDVLRAKYRMAEYYLLNTELSVREIAELCGFDNDVHFMRQFKKRTGMTALGFRDGRRLSG